MTTRAGNRWFLTGVFLVALATMLLEVLDTRLLSVLSWYHLSFFAVSVAMFGLTAGALRVQLAGSEPLRERPELALARHASLLALTLPLTHTANLVIVLPETRGVAMLAALAVTTLALALPFYLAGVVLTVALTRIPAPVGLVYGVDLCGAALGPLVALPALARTNLSAATFACAALAALAGLCFQRGARRRASPGLMLLALLLLGAAFLNTRLEPRARFMPWSAKGRSVLDPGVEVLDERWNIHSQVLLLGPLWKSPVYWAPGKGSERYRGKVPTLHMVIDGQAATWLSSFDGDPRSLAWAQHDLTALAYQLRKQGEVAVVGVGGGRDLLAALWAKSRRILGLEVNEIFLDLLREPRARGGMREFCPIADRPEVELVHDEARSYLTRSSERFDVLQLALIDTWAATGAGAFTLTENGLYTLESFGVLLRALRPTGILSVSRWYDPEQVSETSRLLSLATAALLERGLSEPARHLVLASSGEVATLLLSPTPFAPADLERLQRFCQRSGFQLLLAPDHAGPPELARIVSADSRASLERAVADADYDYSPPTDARPYFFNMLRPRAYLASLLGPADARPTTKLQGVLAGNLQATSTLCTLALLASLMVLVAILLPLARVGLPRAPAGGFAAAVLYFACIGLGFMLVQIPLMQRFSVYLGHPSRAVVLVLSAMVFGAGIGSALSERLPFEERPRLAVSLALLIAVTLASLSCALPLLIERTIHLGFRWRAAIVVTTVAPLSLLLGMCFPLGMRLARRISDQQTPWLWGINGACSVLGPVLAVAISIWAGIDLNLRLAAGLYGLLALLLPLLSKAGRAARA